ncbi:hypothetical protein [Falsirhodobacter sp. 1013]|uniref:hypothetical protein n=1 Tax=Falsirhodobacter sp. 1013 TaxID=3417566 RepID=UPI003EB6B97E
MTKPVETEAYALIEDVGGAPKQKTPLEYMLGVMNNATANEARRDRLAIAAAPFMHSRAEAAAPGEKDGDHQQRRLSRSGELLHHQPEHGLVDV